MIDNFDVTIVKGDTARWSNFFKGVTSGVAFNFVGCTLYMQVRNGYNPSTLVASYDKYVDSNSTLLYPEGFTGGISAGTGGTVYICLGYTHSNFLTADRICKYDLKVLTQSNDLYTLLRGNIQVLSPVTDI